MTMNDIPLAKVMDTMGEGVFVLDASCRIVLWNRAMQDLTGWSAEEMKGKPCSDLVCALSGARKAAEGQKLEGKFLGLVNGKTVVRHVECALQTRDGDTVPVLKNARVLKRGDRAPCGVVVTLTDLRPLRKLEQDLAVMRHEAVPTQGLGRLVGNTPRMLEVYERIRLASESDVTALVEGETGTGKELVAEAVHLLSGRHDKPLVKVNCSALSENLLESELFGHVKGAFTGATRDKVGRIERAEGGTLFLDEIGDLSPTIQLKLLRVLQEQEYERVGESITRKADVRFVAATHRRLKQRVAQGRFREDFYYRIRVFSISMPALRQHKQDIPLLCEHFLQQLSQRTGKQIMCLAHDVHQCFMDYCWPGNVRELENALEHAFVTCRSNCVELEDLPLEIRSAGHREAECRDKADKREQSPTRSHDLTRQSLLQTLEACDWNKAEAARRLGINRTTVWRKMKQWDVSRRFGG